MGVNFLSGQGLIIGGRTQGSRVWQPRSVRPDTMSRKDVHQYIHERKRETHSVDEQVEILHEMWDQNYGPNVEGFEADELEDELGLDLEYKAKTSLDHLTSIDLVEEYGSYTLVIADWMAGGEGEVVNGEVEEAAREGINGLISDLEPVPDHSSGWAVTDGSGATVRGVVSSTLDVAPEKVDNYLRTTDDPVTDLRKSVDRINETDGIETSDDYGDIWFTNRAYRYRLTPKAVNLYNR